MEISVKVSDELAAQQVAALSLNFSFPRTEAEVRSWLVSMTQFSDKIPPLPETISHD